MVGDRLIRQIVGRDRGGLLRKRSRKFTFSIEKQVAITDAGDVFELFVGQFVLCCLEELFGFVRADVVCREIAHRLLLDRD